MEENELRDTDTDRYISFDSINNKNINNNNINNNLTIKDELNKEMISEQEIFIKEEQEEELNFINYLTNNLTTNQLSHNTITDNTNNTNQNNNDNHNNNNNQNNNTFSMDNNLSKKEDENNIIEDYTNSEIKLQEQLNNQQDEEIKLITIDEALNHLGFNRYQFLLFNICGLSWLFEGFQSTLISFLIPQISLQLNLQNSLQSGSLGSIFFFGMIFGSFFGGFLSDLIGRKFISCSSILFATFFAILSCFSIHFWMLFSLRLFIGVGCGAMLVTDYSLLMEFIPSKSKRGRLMSVMQIYWALGALIECVIAYVSVEVIGKSFNEGNVLSQGWRWCIMISSVVGVFIFILRLIFVYESPRYYLVREEYEKVDRIMDGIAKWNGKKLDGNVRVRLLVVTSSGNGDNGGNSGNNSVGMEGNEEMVMTQQPMYKLSLLQQLTILFSKDYVFSTVLLCCVWFLMSYGGWGFSFLIPIVFQDLDIGNVYLNTFYVTLVGLLSSVLVVIIIDRVPRKMLLTVSFILTGLVTAFIGVNSESNYKMLVLAMSSNFLASFPWATLYIYTPEIYPTSIRATGMGICSAFARVAGTLTPLIGTIMLEKAGNFVPFLTFGIAFALAGLFCFLLPRETLNQTLVDIPSKQQVLSQYQYTPLLQDLTQPLNDNNVEIMIEENVQQ
ncbi:hypothetical protein ABK040_001419 [Willaertia magna]